MNWIADIVIGVLAMVGTLGGAYLANKKSTALIAYRLEQLEKKVDLHNKVIERTYQLEKETALINDHINENTRRIEELEGK